MASAELAARFESPNDLLAVRKDGHVVATFGMSLQRQNLTIDTETPYSVVGTELKRGLQCFGVRHAQPRQLIEGSITVHTADGFDCGVAKPDRLL